MRLDKDTYGTVLLVYLACAVAIFLLFLFVSPWWITLVDQVAAVARLTVGLRLADLLPHGA